VETEPAVGLTSMEAELLGEWAKALLVT
jgi:hypothetical protein